MFNWTVTCVLFAWMTFQPALSQSKQETNRTQFPCSFLSPTPTKKSIINGVETIHIDSIAVQASIDSAYMKVKGRWRLIEIRTGWTSSQKPAQLTELTFDSRGHGVIIKNGHQSTSIDFLLSRTTNVFHFPIRQQGDPFFFPRCKSGDLLVCEESLILTESMGDGNTFIFERIS